MLLDQGGRDSSEVELLAPPQDLETSVEHMWIQGGHGTVTTWRVVADTSPYVIASVAESAGSRCIRVEFIGARTRAADVDVTNRVLTVGVRLRVGVLPALTGASAREFVDRAVRVENVFRSTLLSDLELGHDAPPHVIVRALVQLLHRLPRPEPSPVIPDPASPIATVREFAERLDTPTRTLRDRMQHLTGLRPKHLLRVLRLHTALQAARRGDLSWSGIAYVAGYADQAHLTREVRLLLGETPSQWKERGSAVSFKTTSRD